MSVAAHISKVPFIARQTFPDFRIPLADFKGHHVKALTKLTQLAPQLDLVLEVRDARAPISTRNLLLDRALQGKEKIIIYSKKDLSSIDLKLLRKWHEDREKFMVIDTQKSSDMKKIINACKSKYEEMYPPPPLGLRMIVIGMPNVGKSTLVNTLRRIGLPGVKTKVARTGFQPGITRATSEIIRICSKPEILLYDTPGVFLPTVKDSQTMLTLSLVGTVKPNLVDPVIVADYLLFLLNKQDPTGNSYKKFLPHPTNDIDKLLVSIAKKIGKYKKIKKTGEIKYDEVGTAIYWVDRFRQGKESKCIFDSDAIMKSLSKENFEKNFQEELQRVKNLNISILNEKSTTEQKKKPKKNFNERKADESNVLFKNF
ncbi:hypothetical protein PACTADRAFT_45309 [Pachysolen tannophilus NRRL Y-2460]|uniref:G domain-containing protein n=1 Tax=Pachysolen tannophilus NRRL Y-2460 TaxID=669874 RepID=A0A1E4TQR3_PACTA|nr:hypothetical protein PACTADRAFT_45309 [Pachysolen tannophilus NRRL Y-2460]